VGCRDGAAVGQFGNRLATDSIATPRWTTFAIVVLRHFPALVLIVAMGFALLLSVRNESPTTDEPVHLTRGLAYYWGPDTTLSYAHPPLGNAFAALPIALTEQAVAMGRLKGYRSGNVDAVAQELIAPNYEEHRGWLFTARAAVALLTLALALYLYVWCRSLWQGQTALIALLFFTLHPTLVAHGRLNTTDMAVTALMFVSVCELISYLVGKSKTHAFACAIFTGLALATKYTALALLPIEAVVLAVCVVARRGRFATARLNAAAMEGFAVLLLVGLVTLVTLNAAYRFERTGLSVQELLALPEPLNHVTRSYKGTLLERETWLDDLPAAMPIPLPHTYLVGLASMRAHDRQGHPTTFFGKRSSHGHPAYFPVLLAIKTPTLLLFCLALGLGSLVRRRTLPGLPSFSLAVFACVLVALAMRVSINIGVRHVLPVMPVLAVLGGRAAARAMESRTLSYRSASVLSAGLAVAQALGMAWAFPDYLSDFNILVGGRAGGERISIVGEEWGQDTQRLGTLLAARGIRNVLYHPDNFTGRLELSRLGVSMQRLTCGVRPPVDTWAAVHARDLRRDTGRCFAWTRDRTPAFEIPGHVFVYAPPRPANLATK